MGAVGGMLGLSGGNAGTGFSTPSGVNQDQLNQSFNQNQQGMAQQQQLLQALQGQHGLQNQSQVYNQFQNVANGQGPNPAQAMLNQATGANVANQAALMAGQRGSSANAGLMARQAAQTGAGLQQQAAGQGASMQAQQALGALGQAGGMATQMAGQQIGQTNANVNAAQNEQSILQGANTAHNNVMGQLAQQGMAGQQKVVGGMMNMAGMPAGMAQGGQVPQQPMQSMFARSMMADGGAVAQGSMPTFHLIDNSNKKPEAKKASSPTEGATTTAGVGDAPDMSNKAAGGGKVPALVSPGEKELDPKEAKMVAGGKVSPSQVGKIIPGKAKVEGDSYSNDTVKKDLPVGGVIIPRSVMQSKNPEKGAAEFVRAVMAKKGKKA